ncbi:MAG: hypothetical protein ACI9S8_001345 [Chlamydiales bacterium]|jgi:hypothetical protein
MPKGINDGSQPIDYPSNKKQDVGSEKEKVTKGENKATDTVETLFGKVEAARIRTKIKAKRDDLQKSNEIKLPKEELVKKVVTHLERIETSEIHLGTKQKKLIAEENNLVELIALIEYSDLPNPEKDTLLELIETGITVMAQSEIANQSAQALSTGVTAAGKQVMIRELTSQLEEAKTPEEAAIILHSNMDKLNSRQKKFVEQLYDLYVGVDTTLEALKRPAIELVNALAKASIQ